MKANALLKWLVPGALVAVVLIILRSWVSDAPTSSSTVSAEAEPVQLTADQAKSLGIAGDTPATRSQRWWDRSKRCAPRCCH